MIHTLSARLTLWVLSLFALLSLAAFSFTYVNLTSTLSKRIDKRLAQDAFEIAETLRTQGLKEAIREINLEAESEGVGRVFLRLFSSGQELLATSDLNAWPALDSPQKNPAAETGNFFETLVLPGMKHKTRILTQGLEEGYVLQIGYLLKDDERLLKDFREVFGTASSIMLLGGALTGFLVAKRAMKGVERIRQTTDRISQGDFSQRVPLGKDGEEIENLARAFNRMQERIQILIGELRDVSNNIAHDLRSPLTSIRGLAEMTLTGNQNIEDYREMAAAVIEESDKMVNMVNTMLEIAETDAGLRKTPENSVDMADIVRDVGELFFPVAEDKGVEIEVKPATTRLVVQGDRTRLQRAVANLLDNAIKYTPSGGKVTICAKDEATRVVISIADTGIGIPEGEQSRVFERFYRLDQSRSTPGSGLGLSLVQAVIHAHGGEVHVESEVGRGSVFTIRLPKQPV
jgi:heavy metal sensor kinase